MSFILDALKKIEQKKQRDSVPDILSVHDHSEEDKINRSAWPYIIIAALLINAFIMITVYNPWSDTVSDISVSSSHSNRLLSSNDNAGIAINSERLTVSNNTKALNTNDTSLSASKAFSVISDESDPSSDISKDSSHTYHTAVKESEAGDKVDSSNDGNETSIDNSITSITAKNLGITSDEIKKLKENILEESSINETGSLPSVKPEPDYQAHDTSSLPEYSQLSKAEKDRIPELSISGHIYSNSRHSRIVNINGTIYREGDSISSGLKVDEITVSGVILNLEGSKFSLRAF